VKSGLKRIQMKCKYCCLKTHPSALDDMIMPALIPHLMIFFIRTLNKLFGIESRCVGRHCWRYPQKVYCKHPKSPRNIRLTNNNKPNGIKCSHLLQCEKLIHSKNHQCTHYEILLNAQYRHSSMKISILTNTKQDCALQLKLTVQLKLLISILLNTRDLWL